MEEEILRPYTELIAYTRSIIREYESLLEDKDELLLTGTEREMIEEVLSVLGLSLAFLTSVEAVSLEEQSL